MSTKDLDIFIHIHKTGGQTLSSILDEMYVKSRVFNIDYSKYIESTSTLLSGSYGHLELIKGHQFYGLHKNMVRSCSYFTMLRDPVGRFISLYNYLRWINFYPEIKAEEMDLLTFLKSGLALAADNGMTRFLGGFSRDQVSYGRMNIDHADAAIANMSKDFKFIGLAERYDLSLITMKAYLNWPKEPLYIKKNVTEKKYILREDLSDTTLEEIKDYLEPDIKVYNYALERFDEDVAAVFGSNNCEFLRAFQVKNQKYRTSPSALRGQLFDRIKRQGKRNYNRLLKTFK